MFLRSLSLRGFKSFAERTTLEFAPGISVIVGPNGSGKSNLVDAISWVLGEQGPRALRGGQMADVIFAGTPGRSALGLAEVHLVIDNSAGLIPVPLVELEISRTIFRSGDSEYRVGGKVCRLLDIQELLSDTGIGRAQHTVVGQGQLEDVLLARPEERRQYIEEAAGIAKHRRRKDRAERKLASVEQDLLRLQDVLAELRRQLKPLRQQAEVARRHEELQAQAEELSWRVAAARLRVLQAERESRRSGWEEGLARRQDARDRLEALDRDIASLGEERERTGRALQEAEAAFQDAQQEKSEAEAALRQAMSRESEARSRMASETARSARLAQLDDEIGRGEAALQETEEALAGKERDLERAERRFRARDLARREAEDERRHMAEEAVAHRAEVETLRRSLSSSERERERLESALSETRRRIGETEAEREALDQEIEGLDAEETPLSERQVRLESQRHGLAAEVAELEEHERGHETKRALLEARRRDLLETPGSRFLASHRGRAVGLLRDLVTAPPELERALAAALGPFGDAVVYEDRGRALEDAAEGDGAVLGAASHGEPSAALPEERRLLDALRVDGRASGLASALLADVYLADDLTQAEGKHRAHPEASFVTPDGVLVGANVIRTAGHPDSRAEALRKELHAVERDLAAARSALRPRRSRLDEVRAELEKVAAALDRTDGMITAAAERMGRMATDLAALRKEEEVTAERLQGLDHAAAAWREALAAAEPVRHELPAHPPLAEAPMAERVDVEALRRDRSRLESALARLRRERDVLAAEDPLSLREALRDAESARARAEERLVSAEQVVANTVAARGAAAEADRRATAAEAEANRAWRDAAALLERLREDYEQEDRLRGDLERRTAEAERLLREGHGRDPDEAVAALAEDETADDLERRAELVARRLALLGRVNLLAGGEFEALEERHDFLARELDDVRVARRDLLEVIRQVDDEVVSLFDAAFRDVAAEFEALFADVFPGGEGGLVLTDPADLLGTGIEIEARPGRKRVRRISLLSGGERALTALAFLFAIFRARPSPFYLLDEVEAALDDINLSRFLRLIRGFARDSQVLLVTHQKRTMEAADALYGISMGKDGASTVICQRFDGADRPADGPASARVPQSDPVH
jgi:chromosome segregation protein